MRRRKWWVEDGDDQCTSRHTRDISFLPELDQLHAIFSIFAIIFWVNLSVSIAAL
jgi:hypothetical protein